jgi:hypothetical protein
MFDQHCFIDALETVLAWNLPDEVLPIVIGDQMKLLAGFNAEESWIGLYN